MIAPAIIFILTFVVLLFVHLRHQIPLFRAIARLNEAVRLQGRDWSYWFDWRLRLRLSRNPEAIFDEADSPNVRALKQQVVDLRGEVRRAFPKMLVIMFGGFILMILSAIFESGLRATK